jgi:hypothetical protein
MDVVVHGGKCCGIKTIRSFPGQPDHKVPARVAKDNDKPDLLGASQNMGKPFHAPALPIETGKERLDRLIEYVREKRPSHMVEAVLNQWQLPYWSELLRERGFRMVTTYTNSNTQLKIYVFHLVFHQGKLVKSEDVDKTVEEWNDTQPSVTVQGVPA